MALSVVWKVLQNSAPLWLGTAEHNNEAMARDVQPVRDPQTQQSMERVAWDASTPCCYPNGSELMDTEISNQLSSRYKQMRTHTLLDQAPALAVQLLADIAPGGSAQGSRVSGSKEIPLPLNARALEDANGIYAQLANWAISHARALGATPPASVLGWFRLDRDCDGFPSWATLEDAAALVKAIADWLVHWEISIAKLPSAATYWDDVKDIVDPIAKRYEAQIRTDVVAAEDCPICAKRRTVIVNEDPDTAEIVVACTFCGYVVPHAFRKKYLAWKLQERQW